MPRYLLIGLIKSSMANSKAERGWAGLLKTERTLGRKRSESPARHRGDKEMEDGREVTPHDRT